MIVLYKERLKGKANPHWKGGKVEKTCPICGKIFLVEPGQIEEIAEILRKP